MLDIYNKGLILCIVVLLVFNIVLLRRLSNVTAESSTWKNKVTLSISEQLTFFEHSIEGEDLAPEIEELRHSSLRFNNLFTSSKNHKLIYHFWGTNCRRCLNMEIQIFNKLRHQLKENNIDVIMLFLDFKEVHYLTLVKQYQLEDVALRDTTLILLKKFDYLRNPMILLLSRDNHILLANLSDFQNEKKSLSFYRKLFIIMRDYYNNIDRSKS